MYYIGERDTNGFFAKEDLRKFFKKQIMAIGQAPMTKQISLKDLKDRTKARTYVQFAYRESEKRKLNLGIVEFLCWLSTDRIAGKIIEGSVPFAKIPDTIKALYVSDLYNVKNMLRLFHCNEQFMLDALGVTNYADRKHLFAEISKIWYDAKLAERKS